MLAPLSGKRIEFDIRSYRYHQKEHTDAKTKISAAAGSVIGTIIPMVYFAKKQNKNLFKLSYGLKEMIVTSTGSIAGGVAAGLICDKKANRKQKINEGVFQCMNASVPPLFTTGLFFIGSKAKKLNNLPFKIGATFIGLLGGMHIAAKISNKINDPYDKVPDRKLTLKDSIANIDDALGVLVLAKVPFASSLHLEKILPAIFSWCGYRAGVSN